MPDHSPTTAPGTYGAPCQQAFAQLARTHRGRPAAEVLPLPARAADRALLGFSPADLWEQAQAISGGERYVLRVTVTCPLPSRTAGQESYGDVSPLPSGDVRRPGGVGHRAARAGTLRARAVALQRLERQPADRGVPDDELAVAAPAHRQQAAPARRAGRTR
ncbi:hypothetical protein ABT236_30515 [Streptomyces sp. NPDC001523]|uniref:hypothetical protein n=1 Tax=Streptomyces sp. NPDC001523 TaxID=3154383 RepID=UPI00331ED376